MHYLRGKDLAKSGSVSLSRYCSTSSVVATFRCQINRGGGQKKWGGGKFLKILINGGGIYLAPKSTETR